MPSDRGLARSLRLLRAFRREQTDPVGTYTLMGDDAAETIAGLTALAGAVVVDVGGGPGYTAAALRARGSHAFTVDSSPDELELHGSRPDRAVVGDGCRLPLASGSVDVCASLNAIEHVPDPEMFLEETLRVVRPGGLVFIGVTNWFSPWGGHETSPWHYLGGERAARRYERRHGRPPKNRWGESLFRVDVGELIRWARSHPGIATVDAFPRYYPSWCRPLTRVPGLREIATWNLGLAMERR